MMDPEDMHNMLLDHGDRIRDLEKAATEPDGLEGMTLAQLEAMASRLGSAARTIRDAQALLGGPIQVRNVEVSPGLDQGMREVHYAPAPDSVAAHRLRQLQPPEAPSGKSQLRGNELAAKRQLMDQFKPVVDDSLPADMQAMELEERE